jgi:hypothetical protein
MSASCKTRTLKSCRPHPLTPRISLPARKTQARSQPQASRFAVSRAVSPPAFQPPCGCKPRHSGRLSSPHFRRQFQISRCPLFRSDFGLPPKFCFDTAPGYDAREGVREIIISNLKIRAWFEVRVNFDSTNTLGMFGFPNKICDFNVRVRKLYFGIGSVGATNQKAQK